MIAVPSSSALPGRAATLLSGWGCHLGNRTRAPYPDRDKTAQEEDMSWLILVASGVLEAVWATALGRSDGLTRLAPALVFGVALILSMGGLAWAMRDLPVGTSYAVWVGIGAALTVTYAVLFGGESASALKVLLILGIIGCVVGLKAVG
jgi:quaternary ammonium compound-resistance protein SugE